MSIWVIHYFGVPHNLRVHQAKPFLYIQFATLANDLRCIIVTIAVEVYWSFIAGRYHDPLRRVVNKLIMNNSATLLCFFVDYTTLLVSHTIDSKELTSDILAFEAQLRLPIGKNEQRPQILLNRMGLMITARRKYETITAVLKAKHAMNTSAPKKLFANITLGDKCLLYSEKKGWDSPYTFLYHDCGLFVVLDSKGIELLLHDSMLEPYTKP